MLVLKTIAS